MPQATVRTWDATTRAAVIVDDSLQEFEVSGAVFRASRLLELRIGQRVRFEIGTDGTVEAVQVVTL